MIPAIIGGAMAATGLFSKIFGPSQEFQAYHPAVTSLGLPEDIDDYRFGVDIARENYDNSGGFYEQGKGLLDEARNREEYLLRSAVGDAAPTLGTLRGYSASTGLGYGASATIGAEQNRMALNKAQDVIYRGVQDIGSRYARSLVDVLGQGQQFKQQAFGQYLNAVQQTGAAELGNIAANRQFSANTWNEANKLNAQMYTGYSGQRAQSWGQAADSMLTGGLGMLGMSNIFNPGPSASPFRLSSSTTSTQNPYDISSGYYRPTFGQGRP